MKILAVGMNYPLHAEEMKDTLSSEPVFFAKSEASLLVNNKPFFYPDFSSDIHYETELVVKINRLGKCISPRFAHRYYSEITVGIDFTARDLQRQCKEKGWPWEIAKAFDHSAPVGNMVAIPALSDPHNIRFRLDLNGNTVQEGCSADMIFSIDQLISRMSKYFTVKTGDLIFTGTPSGVGPVHIGDHLQAYLENQRVLDFWVR
ncbi:MAG: fumarylacetoacetate hydrolase family protein [Bacteroidales bacterium]|jgi:2-keto-4-pentenoate hydratase/2-oxohepta-3-ene-1,7-dioic acid hydratase in catechol pathway|nr:fumarylacetoacetate hydrolase family protein [Bacteroidales bacterium]